MPNHIKIYNYFRKIIKNIKVIVKNSYFLLKISQTKECVTIKSESIRYRKYIKTKKRRVDTPRFSYSEKKCILNHNVHDFIRDHDDFFRCFPFEPLLRSFISQNRCFNFGVGCTNSKCELETNFSIE